MVIVLLPEDMLGVFFVCSCFIVGTDKDFLRFLADVGSSSLFDTSPSKGDP